jgi:hypothetical protein
MTEVEQIASGQVRFHLNREADKFVKATPRCQLTPQEELHLWECFETLCKELGPKCQFYQDGVGNSFEKQRRNAMFGIMRMVNLRSQDPIIEQIFKRNFGKVSLAWMMTCCGTAVPPFYYKWAFDAIEDISGKTWGPKALAHIEKSWDHMEVFRKLDKEKFDLLAVKRVMES